MSVDPRYLLDTSAVLTLIEDEDGANQVEQAMRSERTLLPWTVLMETTYITRQELGEAEADRRYVLLRGSPVAVIWAVDEALILTASRIKAVHRLSFADALIAAYTLQNKAVLMHKDPEFEVLKNDLALEALPYKSTPSSQ